MSEPSPYARRAKIVFLVVSLEGPGETRRYWEALLVEGDQEMKRRKVEELEMTLQLGSCGARTGEVYLEVQVGEDSMASNDD
jgi:hypothetical protein